MTDIPSGYHRHPNGGGLVADTAYVADTVYVGQDARVLGNAYVGGKAYVDGNASVYGNAYVDGNASVYETRQVLTIGPVGSEDGTLTVVFDRPELHINRGCFTGSLEDFAVAVNKTHPAGTPLGDEYRAIIAMLTAMAEHRVPKLGGGPS